MLFAEQVRAARAILEWGQFELAERSAVGIATIRRLEAANGPLRGNAETVWKIQSALQKAGIIFIPDDADGGPGVRLARSEKIQRSL